MKKTIKGFVFGIIITTLLMSTSLGAGVKKTIEVAFNSINLTVNGEKVDADNIVYEDTTYVPLRAAGEILGKEVDWNGNTKTVNIGILDDSAISIGLANNILVQKHPLTWYEYLPSGGYASRDNYVLNKYHIFAINSPYEYEDDYGNIISDYNTWDSNYCVDKKTGEVKVYDPGLGLIEAID